MSISSFLDNPNKIDAAYENHINKLQAQGAEKASTFEAVAASISAKEVANLNFGKGAPGVEI